MIQDVCLWIQSEGVYILTPIPAVLEEEACEVTSDLHVSVSAVGVCVVLKPLSVLLCVLGHAFTCDCVQIHQLEILLMFSPTTLLWQRENGPIAASFLSHWDERDPGIIHITL